MPDISLVDAALMELLANDAALAALCPHGVYWNIRPPWPDATAFVIVGLPDHDERQGLSCTLHIDATYMVKATILATTRTPAARAAARIQDLLTESLPDFTAAGFAAMNVKRGRRIDYEELDPQNKATWFHNGAHYEVQHHPL